MGKALVLILLAAVIGGGALMQSSILSSQATDDTINDHEANLLARQIALSAINIGIAEAKSDFANASTMAYNHVSFRHGLYNLTGSAPAAGIVRLSAAGLIDSAAYFICADLAQGGGGPIESAMIIDATDAVVDFRGNSFLVSGLDTNPPSLGGLPPFNGGPTAGDGFPVHAVGVPNGSVETIFEDETSSNQEDNVVGMDGNDDVYSGPSTFDVDAFYAEAMTQVDTTLTGGMYNGNDVYGAPNDPWVVHITDDATITGTWEGYGVLIIEGNVNIAAGDFKWEGIVYVKGKEGENLDVNLSGGVEVYGALIIQTTEDEDDPDAPQLELDLATTGNASVSYSEDTIDRLAGDFTTIAQPSPKKIYVSNQRESSTGC